MLGEKRSGDIFGPGPKRETGGQEAMAGEAVNSPKVEPQNEHELRQKKRTGRNTRKAARFGWDEFSRNRQG